MTGDHGGRGPSQAAAGPGTRAGSDAPAVSGLTREVLAELGELVARDGARRHSAALARVADAVGRASPAAAAVLRDPGAPEWVSARALGVASARWSG